MPGPHRCLRRRQRRTSASSGMSEDGDASQIFMYSDEPFFSFTSAGKKGKLGSDDDDDDDELEDLSDLSGSDEMEEANTG